jgi:hypothetical protein
MTTNTMVALKTVTVTGSSTPTITINSIPQTYTDLRFVVSIPTPGGSTYGYKYQLGYSGGTIDGGNNYSYTVLQGNGSSPTSGRNANINHIDLYWFGTTQTDVITATFDIQSYANTNVYKTILGRISTPSAEVIAEVGLWRQTFAVDSIQFQASYANFAVGTTISIYGIANADIGAYATGGVITQDANYYYHAFGNSSYFTPTRNLTADILVVAGGGGGGYANGGGGGAGGVVANSAVSLANGTSYTCTVGAGGAGRGGSTPGIGTQGVNSNVTGGSLSLTAAVGGGYGGYANTNGGSGGSGGGGGVGNSSVGGSPTSGQGYAGGNAGAYSTPYYASGGGGGAGAVGNAGNSSVGGGDGGAGTSAYNSWLQTTGLGVNVSGTRYIAAGGGGATDPGGYYGRGGIGGGGNAGTNGTSGNGISALDNTGSGGGGATSNNSGTSGGNGGSGLIIVRYAK